MNQELMQRDASTIEWVPQFPHRGTDASQVHAAVEQVRAEHGGRFTDDDIVHAAEDQGSAMHRIFEWDNGKAGHAYRCQQARTMVRALRITYVAPKGVPATSVRAFEVVVKKPQGAPKDAPRTLYSSHAEAMADPASREALLAEAITQLMSWRRRFRLLNEFDRLFDEIDATVSQVAEG